MNVKLQIVELALFMGYRCLQRKGEHSQWLFHPDSKPIKRNNIWHLERVVGEFEPAEVELNREWLCRRDLCWAFASDNYPDYPNDLNLMHKVAMKLKEKSRYRYAMYLSRLDQLTGAHKDVHLEDAPAAIRAEAVLKTIGKWTDEFEEQL